MPGLLQTLSLVMVNVLNWGLLSEDSSFDMDNSAALAKCWVFGAFVVAFSGIIGAVWILIDESSKEDDVPMWPAVAGCVRGPITHVAGSGRLVRGNPLPRLTGTPLQCLLQASPERVYFHLLIGVPGEQTAIRFDVLDGAEQPSRLDRRCHHVPQLAAHVSGASRE